MYIKMKNKKNHHSTAKPSYAKWMPWGIRSDSWAWGAMSWLMWMM